MANRFHRSESEGEVAPAEVASALDRCSARSSGRAARGYGSGAPESNDVRHQRALELAPGSILAGRRPRASGVYRRSYRSSPPTLTPARDRPGGSTLPRAALQCCSRGPAQSVDELRLRGGASGVPSTRVREDERSSAWEPSLRMSPGGGRLGRVQEDEGRGRGTGFVPRGFGGPPAPEDKRRGRGISPGGGRGGAGSWSTLGSTTFADAGEGVQYFGRQRRGGGAEGGRRTGHPKEGFLARPLRTDDREGQAAKTRERAAARKLKRSQRRHGRRLDKRWDLGRDGAAKAAERRGGEDRTGQRSSVRLREGLGRESRRRRGRRQRTRAGARPSEEDGGLCGRSPHQGRGNA
ncbi:hypothetical protein THAOC_26399 [Thalassiosira oceanica]|uniref:Uncharacterized protein n=1 Tax=Thalassiosira oceanica TaxID=159749 RepID=K0RLJ0_THAOC|nr:hypothetical protein THAOC_26399 [Thalassiosira oceanica]|eukprot:EJK54050.1 hypothetical protein THAOC_26399 [Thalassiosira oceanica]